MNIRFSAQNKKQIMIVGVLVFTLALLFQFIYFPKAKEVKALEAEYKEKKAEIDELYNFIGGRENLEQNIIERRREMALFENAFPSEKEVSSIIKHLNKEARRFNINVISLKPKNLSIYRDEGGKEIRIADYLCKCMPLTLNVESRYQALGELFESLRANRNPVISIQELRIKKHKDIAPKIKAEIELHTFMLGK